MNPIYRVSLVLVLALASFQGSHALAEGDQVEFFGLRGSMDQCALILAERSDSGSTQPSFYLSSAAIVMKAQLFHHREGQSIEDGFLEDLPVPKVDGDQRLPEEMGTALLGLKLSAGSSPDRAVVSLRANFAAATGGDHPIDFGQGTVQFTEGDWDTFISGGKVKLRIEDGPLRATAFVTEFIRMMSASGEVNRREVAVEFGDYLKLNAVGDPEPVYPPAREEAGITIATSRVQIEVPRHFDIVGTKDELRIQLPDFSFDIAFRVSASGLE